jgi:hypothetical protein
VRFVSPGIASAILRSDDDGPDALYPCAIGVYCDECGTVVKEDFFVNDRMTKPERLELIRSHARSLGWACDMHGDMCPPCLKAAEGEQL